MILKGNQRGGGRKMAIHLLNSEQNEHVNVYEVRGFMSEDVLGALNEAYAISKGTKCKQFMYSLSLNPPQNEKVDIDTFEATLDRVEKKLGLVDQPRVVVFHEKEGRRHAHAVWSRIDTEEMKAINIAFPKRKLKDISKSLYLEHGWQLPEGFRDKDKKNPLNYTRAEWQQAARIGRKPADIKRELQECWAVSESKNDFENALHEIGYSLARGDRRGYVAVDIHGEIYSLTRQLGVKKKEMAGRLGNADILLSVSEVRDKIGNQLSNLFTRYSDELKAQHKKDMQPVLNKKQSMTTEHRNVRSQLDIQQKERWSEEEQKRIARIRKGFKGFMDKLNGRYWKTRKANEKETYLANIRDRNEEEELINKQLTERQNLQAQIDLTRQNQEKERSELIRDLSHLNSYETQSHGAEKTQEKEHSNSLDKEHPNEIGFNDPDIDHEPDI